MNASHYNSSHADKLNNLLQALKPELVRLNGILRTAKDIESPYKNGLMHLVALTNMQFQLEKRQDVEGYVNLIIEELHGIVMLFNRVVEDDDFRELYEKQGIFTAFSEIQKNITKIIEHNENQI
ncbi:hypothetical protein ACFORL_09785 [Legionella dresdenensis]|uniref:Uncharacterized protein n=1 Tax=Legionella dresdenensis TaxID=450200 RepID=A0ABV8CGJ6_9GAMM